MADAPRSWSYDRLLSLAPSPQALEQARRLFFARRWRVLEGNGHWLWGEYETPYGQVMKAAVRLEPPLFRCLCKSRQKPCKHSLALVLLFLNRPEAWKVTEDPPDWVKGLLSGPSARPEPRSPTPTSKNKQEKRLALMDQGVEELDRWLHDLLRQGLAQLGPQANDEWERFAARMVDAKLGSIARRIRLCIPLLSREDWPEALLNELGLLYLFVRAWQRKSSLAPPQKRELLQVAGWNTRKDTLLAQDGHTDNWLVIGLTTGTEEKLTFRRTWLRGEKTGLYALVLDFAFGNRGFESQWVVGSVLQGELVYYPGLPPLRALLKDFMPSRAAFEAPAGYPDFTTVGQMYAKALAQSPWLGAFPLQLDNCTPYFDADENRFFLLDVNRQAMAMENSLAAWQLLSISGGHPITIFGEYNGFQFHPLAAMAEGGVIALTAEI